MTTDPLLKIESRDPIKIALSHLVRDWRFMRQHGWTLAAYVTRYGSARKPRLGDGGPLIWQADVRNHDRMRRHFLHTFLHDPWGRGSGVCDAPSLRRAFRVFKMLGGLRATRESERWDEIVKQAERVKERAAA